MSVEYPQTRTVEAVEQHAGVRFPDPYRWLEDDTEDVRVWQKVQGELAAEHVREWPHFEATRALVTRYFGERVGSVPRFAGGRWFRTRSPEGATLQQVIVADEPYGDGRVLVDLAQMDGVGETPFVSWLAPSPDGRVLALGICTDGSEHNTIRLVDVDSGRLRTDAPAQVLHDSWTGGVTWHPDAGSFWFTALTGSAEAFGQALFRHELGEPGPTGPDTSIPLPPGRDYSMVQVSADGRWAVALHRMMTPIPVAVRDLSDPTAPWRPFVTSVATTVAGHVVGNHYVAITDLRAPRGRVVAIPLDAADPNAADGWIELVAESDAVLRGIRPVSDLLYVSALVDTYARVRVLTQDGQDVTTLALPGRGALAEPPFPLMGLVPTGHPDEFLFAFSTLTASWATYRHRPGADGVEVLKPPVTTLDGAVVDDHWATSADGTRVPYHTVRLASASGPLPALIHAYGGFNVALVPQFPGPMVGLAAAGGVFVHAHLRGGSELGRDWWEGGRMRNKQNCYADLYAIAEDLVAEGIAPRDRIAVTGGSNGGLLTGVAVTQRPELWAAAVPRVPFLDLLGGLRDAYGNTSIRLEFADPDDPEEVRRLTGFSPYHLVREGTHYPPVFIDAGDTDPRCPPWHARKWAARMQAAQAGDAPILLRVWENVGHGWATPKQTAVTETTEWLAFVLRHLALQPPAAAAQ